MRNQLRDVKVRRVSFVDRASVRDPEAPEQPRTWLLMKADNPTPTEDRKMATATTSLGQAIAQAMADHSDEVGSDMRDRLNQISQLAEERRRSATAKPVRGDEAAGRTAEEVHSEALMTLSKAERFLPVNDRQARMELKKAGQRSQLALLAERNPRAAEQYERENPELIAA